MNKVRITNITSADPRTTATAEVARVPEGAGVGTFGQPSSEDIRRYGSGKPLRGPLCCRCRAEIAGAAQAGG